MKQLSWLEVMQSIFDQANAIDLEIEILKKRIAKTKAESKSESQEALKLFKQTLKANLKKKERAEVKYLRDQIRLKKLAKNDLNRTLKHSIPELAKDPELMKTPLPVEVPKGYGYVTSKIPVPNPDLNAIVNRKYFSDESL